jgi:predicted pyridoxine 5'-phosphate oxidase superfamily flavin-nucleotide-binding protein
VETDMSELYGESHRALQDRHDTRRLADRLESLAHRELDPKDRAFIESAAFFFLSTVDEHGRPTVSYKGGPPGFVRIAGPGELVFPVYDGNGMFLSLGNIVSTAQVGLLFIDFESPRRLRIQGAAKMTPNEGRLAVAGAQHLVHIEASQVFVNCGRYIHKVAAHRLSPHVPDEAGGQPFPAWKRIDIIADALPEPDQAKVALAGGPIPIEAYPGEDSPDPSTTVR